MRKGRITASLFYNRSYHLNMKEKTLSPENIHLPESVNLEADRLEENPELMLRLIDLIFFLDDRDPIPS